MHCSKTASLLDRLVDPAGIDVDNSTPNHLNIHVSERDYDINPRFSALIGFVVHGYPHNDFRILRARLRPFALNNFRLFELSKQALHEYPSLQVATRPPRRQGAKRTRAVSFDHQTNRAMHEPITVRETSVLSVQGPNSAVSRFLRHGCFTPETEHCSARLGRQKSAAISGREQVQ
jgi:hypothetical protein